MNRANHTPIQTPKQTKRKRENEIISTEQAQTPKSPRIDPKLSVKNQSSSIHSRVLFHESEITRNTPKPKPNSEKQPKTTVKPNTKTNISNYFGAQKWPHDKQLGTPHRYLIGIFVVPNDKCPKVTHFAQTLSNTNKFARPRRGLTLNSANCPKEAS